MAEYVEYRESGDGSGPRMIRLGKFSFSTTEIFHLTVALVMITLTLMALGFGNLINLRPWEYIAVYFFSVGLGFLLHEIGHKFVAQHYGYISEFRADFFMLFVAFMMAYFIGFVFLAPGAVMILGRLSRKENGIVSVAGPLVNLALASIFVILNFIINPVANTLLWNVFVISIWVNAFLGIFNMLPFWILDGKKVLRWNKKVYFSVLAGLFFFLYGSFTGLFF